MDYEPPFLETYKTLVQKHQGDSRNGYSSCSIVERCDIPLIDLGRLSLEREECMREIAEAAREWGFFQVVNHGISHELLKSLQIEQKKVFYQPFLNKSSTQGKAYRWGNPFATNLRQLSWSEAFHFYLTDISRMDQHETLRYMMHLQFFLSFWHYICSKSKNIGIYMQQLDFLQGTKNCKQNIYIKRQLNGMSPLNFQFVYISSNYYIYFIYHSIPSLYVLNSQLSCFGVL